MNPPMKIPRLALIFLSVVLAGCITPEAQRERRIAENIELFYEFPEEVREAVRRGEVEIGFDEDMVRLAVGSPDRVSRRKNADGELVNWQYFEVVKHSEYEWVRMPVPYTDEKGRSRVRDESFLVDREYKDLELKMEVDFSKGKVVAFETISSN